MIFCRRGILLAGIICSFGSSGQNRPGRLLEYPLPSVREEADAISRTEDEAAVQRVAPFESDWKSASDTPDLTGRPVVQVMHLGDYNRDGLATDFFLQTDAKPCGKHYGVVLGITRDNPRLHAFGTVGHPEIPLSMESDAWEKLRTATAPVKTIDLLCDDHGSDEQVGLELRWSPKGIDVGRRTCACAGNVRGNLLTEAPL